jgi:hypothetical protein
MAKDKKDKETLDHVMYIGAHPSVAVSDVDGEFIRGEALGPFDAETVGRLCAKKTEFVACAAPVAKPVTGSGGESQSA